MERNSGRQVERDFPAREEDLQGHGGGGVAQSWNMQFLYMVIAILYQHIKFDNPFSIDVI